MDAKEFLVSKGLLSDATEANDFIITFEDGREVVLSQLLEEYADIKTEIYK